MRPARALLAGMVDYAGLFPPAELPLDDAVREYAAHLGDAQRDDGLVIIERDLILEKRLPA